MNSKVSKILSLGIGIDRTYCDLFPSQDNYGRRRRC